MKNAILLLAVVFCSFVPDSFGQVYEKIYEEASPAIRTKMNQNKMNGVDILSNIEANHIIGFTGLNNSKLPILKTRLDSHPDIKNYEISSDLKSITIESKASFTKEIFANLVSSLSVVVTGSSVVYLID